MGTPACSKRRSETEPLGRARNPLEVRLAQASPLHLSYSQPGPWAGSGWQKILTAVGMGPGSYFALGNNFLISKMRGLA